ncbi:DNA polymerase III subunit psi [Thalassotalea profundi]|uniref:DNA polymerase III subunit psi n=1 Tax=Thalassotalea profundi TaxID=2036687 RepID=A0ABQ3IQ42_9GAMM|nr:DNA polymerase III subunit psi [Thalassotalea profundi]GHE87700.1 hypothetical protein GCM10011501_16530 [Thalassotalea profundi]
MITNAKQFSYLNAMGIDIWQQKHTDVEKDAGQSHLVIDLDKLCKQQLFIDLIQSLNITLDQITLKSEHCLNLGLINWQFSENNQTNYENNTLTTPAIEQLVEQPKLKRQLWQLLSASSL